MDKRVNCYFYISQKKISRFCLEVKENAAKGQKASTNDILTAASASLIVRSMEIVNTDAQAKPIAKLMQRVFGKKTEKQQEALVSVIASLRPRVATRPSVYDYMGNLVAARFVTVPLELITAEPDASALARIAGHIRDAVNATDAEYICQVGHLVSKRPEGYVQLFMGLIEYKHSLVVSSQVFFDHYDVDFGMGIPVLVRPALLSFPNSVLIMPCYPGTDGYEISMTLTAEVAAKTIQDQHWMSLVDRCDYDV